jgi:hypothetical protein
MSRRIRAGGEPPGDWDFDRNGRIDTSDVNAVAQTAVSL